MTELEKNLQARLDSLDEWKDYFDGSVEKLDYSIVSNSINENLISSLKEVTKHEVKSNLLCKVNKYVEEEGKL